MNSYFIKYINFVFILLFPLFFIYHVLVAKGYIPPFLGGYFSIIALLNFPFLVILSLIYKKSNRQFTLIEIIFFLLLIYTFFIAIVNFLLNPLPLENNEMLIFSIRGIVFSIICYILGKHISIYNENFKKLIVFFLLLFLIIILLNLNEFGMFYLRLSSENAAFTISYQGYARVLTIVGLIAIALIKNPYPRLFVYIVVSISLFFNGARTEFVLFNFAAIIFFTVFMPRIIYIIILGFIVSFIIIMQNETLQNLILENRLLELFTNLESSTSGNARFDTILIALQTISENPLFGNYGSYVEIGGIGYYAHSIISAWVNLGLFGFVLYILLFFLMLLYIYIYKYKKSSIEYKLFLLFFTFTFMAMIVSKDYSYMLMGFLVAFYSRSAYVK